MPVGILIATADEEFRRLLRRSIGGTVTVVGEAEDAEMAARLARERKPAVVFLDLDLPGVAAETPRQMRADSPSLKVILMTGHDEEAYLGSTGRSGADAFLPKRRVKTDVLTVLQAVTGGLDFSRSRGQGAPTPTPETAGRKAQETGSGDPGDGPMGSFGDGGGA